MTSQGEPWKALPDAPGVYFFVASAQKNGSTTEVLYIGRATSLRDRVRSYFNDDVIHTRGALIVDMVFHADKVDFVQTDSVLEAILLEASLIKQHQPRYNTKEKSDKSFNNIIITNEAFPRVLIMRSKDVETKMAEASAANHPSPFQAVFGPYSNGSILRDGLKIVRKIFPFRDRCVPCESVGGAATRGSRCRPCFNRQLGLCPGVCTGEISSTEYKRIIARLGLFLEGKKSALLRQLEKEMLALAKERQFEEANEVKKTIFALGHIQDIGLIKEQDSSLDSSDSSAVLGSGSGPKAPEAMFRIEAYDVAHMSGKNTVGVMTVLEDRQLRKSEYRMFKIKQAAPGMTKADVPRLRGNDDIASLREILSRRLTHPEWTFPNLIVVDGSTAQKRAAEKVLREGGFDIAVVGVVKNDKHKPERILAAPQHQFLIKKFSKEILLLNSEAHRFAIKYHRKVRGRLR